MDFLSDGSKLGEFRSLVLYLRLYCIGKPYHGEYEKKSFYINPLHGSPPLKLALYDLPAFVLGA